MRWPAARCLAWFGICVWFVLIRIDLMAFYYCRYIMHCIICRRHTISHNNAISCCRCCIRNFLLAHHILYCCVSNICFLWFLPTSARSLDMTNAAQTTAEHFCATCKNLMSHRRMSFHGKSSALRHLPVRAQPMHTKKTSVIWFSSILHVGK